MEQELLTLPEHMSSPPDSDYPFGIFKLLMNYVTQKSVRYEINGVLRDQISYKKCHVDTYVNKKCHVQFAI